MRHPSWLKVNIPSGPNYNKISKIIKTNNLHTVCHEARCPNIAECYRNSTATFMIMGDICTRDCQYCNIKSSKPKPLDQDEPIKIARAIKALGLRYAVITSVTRDDLHDFGAKHFYDTVMAIKSINDCKIEILTPDFNGSKLLLEHVLKSDPYVFNHNIEVVHDLFATVRPHGNYKTSLRVLKNAKKINKNIRTKSGLMVGLGETMDQIRATLKDLIRSDVEILTVGQYLQPRRDLAPIVKYYTPGEFHDIQMMAQDMGFRKVFSGPLVRSSYHADEIVR